MPHLPVEYGNHAHERSGGKGPVTICYLTSGLLDEIMKSRNDATTLPKEALTMRTPVQPAAKADKSTKVTSTKPSTFTLANLARELNINPKIARQRARKNAAKFKPLLATDDPHSHIYHVKHRDAIASMIKPRPKAPPAAESAPAPAA